MKEKFDGIIKKTDLAVIEKMAKEYGLSVTEFCDFVKSIGRKPVVNMRLSDVEAEVIDRKAKLRGIARSEYLRRCVLKVVEENLIMDIDLVKIHDDSYFRETKRNIRLNVRFADAEDYNKVVAAASKFSLKLSSFIRYCAMAYDCELSD